MPCNAHGLGQYCEKKSVPGKVDNKKFLTFNELGLFE
jgi:hypothetical protein